MGKQAVIVRHIAENNFWHIAKRRFPAFNEDVRRVNQISVDVLRLVALPTRINDFWLVIRLDAKSDNHTMHRRLFLPMRLSFGRRVRVEFRFLIPAESAVREVDMHAALEKRLPKRRHSIALCDGVGRNERGTNDSCLPLEGKVAARRADG